MRSKNSVLLATDLTSRTILAGLAWQIWMEKSEKLRSLNENLTQLTARQRATLEHQVYVPVFLLAG